MLITPKKLIVHNVKVDDEIFRLLYVVKRKNKLKNRQEAIRWMLEELGYIKGNGRMG